MDMEGHGNCTGALQNSYLCPSIPDSPDLETSDLDYVSALESIPASSSTEAHVESTSSFEPSPSEFASSRIERMMQRYADYETAPIEVEIEASKDHWSELDPMSAVDNVNELDHEILRGLSMKWGNFFHDYGDRLVVGNKIAEGGQAEIFKAEIQWSHDYRQHYILKVFKEGWALRNLQKQWPTGMLQNRPGKNSAYFTDNSCVIYGGTILENGRFAFMMQEYWGDLRKLIDYRMKHNHNQSPPFKNEATQRIVLQIATGVAALHEHNIIHRDLKASNILVSPIFGQNMKEFDPAKDRIDCYVADFECSVGVVGTGYWRAPEILSGLQLGNIQSHLFSEKSDAYSFAMTCYEVLTGCIPFEDLAASSFDVVLEGNRPELPSQIDPLLKTLLNRCWHANPSKRPSFKVIVEDLLEIYPKCRIAPSYGHFRKSV